MEHNNQTIKPITLEISRTLWFKFKAKVNRDRTLNTALVDLIKKEVGT